jgi:hypothetical protein
MVGAAFLLGALFFMSGCSTAEPDATKRRVEPAGKFSFVPPKGWAAHKISGQDFAVYLGFEEPPPALEFRRDLSVADDADSAEFVERRIEGVYEATQLLDAKDFTTDSGLRGKRIVFDCTTRKEGAPALIRQIVYLFPNGGDTHAFWGSAPHEAGHKYDDTFDAVARSYRIESP